MNTKKAFLFIEYGLSTAKNLKLLNDFSLTLMKNSFIKKLIAFSYLDLFHIFADYHFALLLTKHCFDDIYIAGVSPKIFSYMVIRGN